MNPNNRLLRWFEYAVYGLAYPWVITFRKVFLGHIITPADAPRICPLFAGYSKYTKQRRRCEVPNTWLLQMERARCCHDMGKNGQRICLCQQGEMKKNAAAEIEKILG